MLNFIVKLRKGTRIKKTDAADLLSWYAQKPLSEIRETVEKWMDERKFPQEKRTNLLFEVLKEDLSKLAINIYDNGSTVSINWPIKYGDTCNVHYLIPILLQLFTKKSIKRLQTSSNITKSTCSCGNNCDRAHSKTLIAHIWFQNRIKDYDLQNTYSWGELYETLKKMSDNGDDHKDPLFTKAFELFAKLDNAVGKKHVKKILANYSFTEDEINRINSPCLDGIIALINFEYPLTKFLKSKHSMETLKYFLDRKICNRSVIQAISFDRVDALELFAERGADIKTDEKMYLSEACAEGCSQCIRFFANKDSISNEDFLLASDSQVGNDIIQLFIDYGIDINCKKGRALLNAFLLGNKDRAEFLISKGAKIMNYVELYNINMFWNEWDD